jgi:hypothetical protein
MEVWLLSGGLVCDVSSRGLVVYGGLVAVCLCVHGFCLSVCGLILNVIWFRVLASK